MQRRPPRQSKVAGATRRRDAYMNAFSNVFKFAPRVAIPFDRVAEEAFGVDVEIPASTTIDADQPADNADFVLEEELESVMNNDTDIGNMRVLAAHDVVFFEPVQAVQPVEGEETDDEAAQVKWVQCTKCSEHCVVPSGQYLTFQSGDVKFFCRFVGATCHLVKRRRFA